MRELAAMDQLDQIVQLARKMGFEIREESLDGQGAAVCQIKGRNCLFLDINCRPNEQLEAIRNCLFPQALSVKN